MGVNLHYSPVESPFAYISYKYMYIYIYHITWNLNHSKMTKHKNDEYDAIKIISSLYPCTVWRLIMKLGHQALASSRNSPSAVGNPWCVPLPERSRLILLHPVWSWFTSYHVSFTCENMSKSKVHPAGCLSLDNGHFDSWKKKSPASPSFGAFRALAHSGHRRVLAAWSVVCV